jgi:hypothetical protein
MLGFNLMLVLLQEIKMDDEIKCAPWNTTRAYCQVR